MSTIPFRRFKVPGQVETQFFSVLDDGKNDKFAQEDLEKSGLTLDDVQAYTSPLIRLKDGAQAGYIIPYHDLKGNPIVDEVNNLVMFRTRMKYPDFSREQRYTQPSAEQLAKYGLPPYVPYIHPLTLTLPGEELICAEGEKKAASIIKYLSLPTFGIGGCQLWRNPDGLGGIHPWIRDLVSKRGATRITIVPDGDIRRYDICSAYGNFARALENEGIAVRILDPRGKIDDLLAQWGADANANWDGIQSLNIDDLVQSPSSLIKKYGLAFKTDAKDKPLVFQHTANVMRLMEEHSAFPKFWRNLDNNRIFMDDEPLKPNLTEMEIANYFQHNLGMDKVNHVMTRTCIGALARKNERSPMLEHIKSQTWDGICRLDSWLCRMWGVEDSDFLKEVSSKWLISACARMDQPGTKIDWMLIVIGPQGTGKTTMPSLLFGELYHPLYGEQNDKDFHMLLHSYLCVGFDELDSFNRKESSTLKAMITRNEDSFRPPYAAEVETFKRRFTLYGCGNRHDFIQHDASGYRRYAVIEIAKKLDFAGLIEEKDQLWAEAWQRYKTIPGEFWEISNASEEAEKFVIANPMEDTIDEFLARKCVDKIGGGKGSTGLIYFKMTELLIHLELEREATNSLKIKDIAAMLHKRGIVKPDKASRHPDTKAVGKWYIYDPASAAPI